jgi:hypothetical protein
VPVSLQPVHALYYSAANTVGNRIVGAIADEGDKNKCVDAVTPRWPLYRSDRPYGFNSNCGLCTSYKNRYLLLSES